MADCIGLIIMGRGSRLIQFVAEKKEITSMSPPTYSMVERLKGEIFEVCGDDHGGGTYRVGPSEIQLYVIEYRIEDDEKEDR